MPTDPIPGDGCTEYERQRQEQMKRNRERMEELQLPMIAATLGALSAKAAPKRAPAKKRREPTPQARQSARLRGVQAPAALVAGVKSESAGGKIELELGSSAVDAARSASKRERHPQGPLPLKSDDATPGSDAAFLTMLRGLQLLHDPSSPASPSSVSLQDIPRLGLRAEDVAKVTRDGTTGMMFHPSTSAGLLLAAADKQGNVAFWHVDQPCAGSEGGNGILSMKVHNEYISSICWLGEGAAHVLASSSYDGSVRLLDLNAGCFDQLQGLPEDIEISVMSASPDAQTLYVGNNLGELLLLDPRQGRVSANLDAHDRRLNTIELHRDGVTLCTSGTDAQVKLWDLRKLEGGTKPLHTLSHLKSCHAAYFAPDGSQRILSTSYDDTLRIWEGSTPAGRRKSSGSAADVQWQEVLVVKHNNNTGRWIVPFRSIWGPGCDWIACGSMKKGIDVHCARTGKQLALLQSEFMTAIPSRLCLHKETAVLAAATGSGRIHLWRPNK